MNKETKLSNRLATAINISAYILGFVGGWLGWQGAYYFLSIVMPTPTTIQVIGKIWFIAFKIDVIIFLAALASVSIIQAYKFLTVIHAEFSITKYLGLTISVLLFGVSACFCMNLILSLFTSL